MSNTATNPAFKLIINGKQLSINRDQLIALTLTDHRAFEADQLSVTIADPGNKIALPKKGAKVECWLGWTRKGVSQLTYKGSFIVDDIGYDINPREITLQANSANFIGGLAKVETKSYNNKTLGQIAARIAKKHRLSLKIPVALDSIAIAHIDQNNEGDGHFLTRLAQRHDAMLNIKNDTLIILPQGQGKTANGQALSRITFDVKQCETASYKEADRASEYTGVKAKWHNTATGKTVWEVAGKPDKVQQLKHRYPTQDEALRAANTEWRKIQRGKKTLTLNLTEGKPHWVTETPVNVRGIKKQINEVDWVTVKVIHQIDEEGYTCSGELEQVGQTKLSLLSSS